MDIYILILAYYYVLLDLIATATSICTSSGSLNIFDINFLDFSVFTATTIDLYSHPNGLQFNDAARLSPIPTKYMGFYLRTQVNLYQQQVEFLDLILP